MAYKVIILYQLYMPSYFLGTFTEYPKLIRDIRVLISRFLYLLDYILNTLSRHYNIIYDLTLPKTILHAYINTTA